jgi:uncharacterized protein (DUF433 family)
MATTWLTDRITVDPDRCFGKPTIRGTRLAVVDILDNLAGGATREEILEDFPMLEPEDITAALDYAASVMRRPVIIAA